ncbi:hypothetical protein X975_10092, partial [Stegodyphus mimosarum]
MLPPLLRSQNRGLLVWDSASTHRAKDMKNFLAEKNFDQIMISAGITGYFQTLDIAINKPFKDHLRMEINEYIENRMASYLEYIPQAKKAHLEGDDTKDHMADEGHDERASETGNSR